MPWRAGRDPVRVLRSGHHYRIHWRCRCRTTAEGVVAAASVKGVGCLPPGQTVSSPVPAMSRSWPACEVISSSPPPVEGVVSSTKVDRLRVASPEDVVARATSDLSWPDDRG